MRLLLVFLIACPLVTFSQSTETMVNKNFFVGLTFSPDFCYRTIVQNDKTMTDEQWNTAKNIEDSVDTPKFGYTTGLAFGYQIGKRISLESGLYYSNKGYRTISIATLYDINQPPANARHIFSFSYLDIPLKANVILLDQKFQFVIGIGAALNILLKASEKAIPDNPTTEFPIETTEIDYEYNKINLSPMASLGLLYHLSNRLSVRVEPTLRYSLINIDDDSYKSTHFWSTGLNVGIYVSL